MATREGELLSLQEGVRRLESELAEGQAAVAREMQQQRTEWQARWRQERSSLASDLDQSASDLSAERRMLVEARHEILTLKNTKGTHLDRIQRLEEELEGAVASLQQCTPAAGVESGVEARAMGDLLSLLDAETTKASQARNHARQAEKELERQKKEGQARGIQLEEANRVSQGLGVLLKELESRFASFGSDLAVQEGVAEAESRLGETVSRLEQSNRLLRHQVEGQERAREEAEARTGRRIAVAEDAVAGHERRSRDALSDLEASSREAIKLRVELEDVKRELDAARGQLREFHTEAKALIQASEIEGLAQATANIAQTSAAAGWWQSRCDRAWAGGPGAVPRGS